MRPVRTRACGDAVVLVDSIFEALGNIPHRIGIVRFIDDGGIRRQDIAGSEGRIRPQRRLCLRRDNQRTEHRHDDYRSPYVPHPLPLAGAISSLSGWLPSRRGQNQRTTT